MASQSKFADVPLRVRTWGYIILVFSIALIHPICLFAFICFLSFWGQLEIFRFAMPSIKHPKVICSVNVITQSLLFYYSNSYSEFLVFVVGYSILSLLLLYVFKYGVYLKYYVTLLLFFSSISVLWYIGSISEGYKLLILLIVPIELNDVFQYLSGKLFGKHKIVPTISPNKTVEGLIGGVIGYTIVFTSLYYALGFHSMGYKLIIIACTMSVLGFLGDVFFSYMKRQANVKDTGTLLPGHGGLLDRLDSLLFTAPLFYFVIL